MAADASAGIQQPSSGGRLLWKHRGRIAWCITLLAVLSGIYFCGRRMADVAALQDSVQRDWQIGFNGSEHRPDAMPVFLDDWVMTFANWYAEPDHPIYEFYAAKPVRDGVLHDRIRSIFRGRITEIDLIYPEQLRGDLGMALKRFPHLRRLRIEQPFFSRADWECVLRGLHELPNLEELELSASHDEYPLVNATLADLSGQPTLRKIYIYDGYLNGDCAQYLRGIPKLTDVRIAPDVIGADKFGADQKAIAEIQHQIREGLPNVEVIFEAKE